MNDDNGNNDFEPEYVKEERAKHERVQDFLIGAALVGSFIGVIAVNVGWITSTNDFFGILGCCVVGYFLNLWVLKPILKKRG